MTDANPATQAAFTIEPSTEFVPRKRDSLMFLRSLATAACCTLLATASLAQQTPASPPATANVTLNGKAVTINYNSPRLKGRTIGSDIVPYGEVWRTGANPATTLITAASLPIYSLLFRTFSVTGLAIASDVGITANAVAIAALLHFRGMVPLGGMNWKELVDRKSVV